MLDFEQETGIKVTVETPPGGDFQTKTLREFAANVDCRDILVGGSQCQDKAQEIESLH